MRRSLAPRVVAVLAVLVTLVCRDAGPRAPIAEAHIGPGARTHAPLGELLADFRSARDTLDRSRLVMSKVDTGKQGASSLRPSSRPVSAAQMQLLHRIEEGVVRLRGLEKQADVPMELLDRDGLREYLTASIVDTDVEKVQGDYLKLLKVVGLTPRSSDSLEATIDMLVDHILGFYDPEEKYMVLINGSGYLGPDEKVTYAHEFTHALQDQNYDLTALMKATSGDDDRAQATKALIEGDATYSMLRWASAELSPAELWEYVFGTPAPRSTVAPSIDMMVSSSSAAFTYGQGMKFVHHLYTAGGNDAVNRALAHPPTTTEQIFHPDRYLKGEGAMTVEIPEPADLLGPGWSSLVSDDLGMLGVGGLVAEFADNRAASKVAEGWGGDRFTLLEHTDGRLAFVLRTSWDTERDAIEFHNSMTESQRNRFHLTVPALQRFASAQQLGGDDFSASVVRRGTDVLVAIATDEATSRMIINNLGFARAM